MDIRKLKQDAAGAMRVARDPKKAVLAYAGFLTLIALLTTLADMGLHFPVFGMVKDDRHRTRALVTPQGQEIRIDNNQAIFALIGQIQEETHRFAITFHRQMRSKRLSHSALDNIPGIGPKRKQELLKQFKSITGIRAAGISELQRILPRDAAMAVYRHFHQEEES